jgi:iron complex transport system ATP-binding protein
MKLIEVKNLSFSYSETEVLRDVSFEVEGGAFLAIVGPNGAGKSTLINLLCGLLKSDSGIIKIDGKPIGSYSTKALSAKIAVVRQEFTPVFGFSVVETVMMSRTTHYGQLGFETETDRQIVNEALQVTDTDRFASRLLSNLSGGERQRVFIARAFAQDTPILLLDEPTSFLDYKHQVGIYDLLKKAQNERQKTILTVTHDINLAAQYADIALLIASDNSYVYGPTMEVFSQKQIEKFFDTKIFTADIGQGKFFLPLGKLAKDAGAVQNEQ